MKPITTIATGLLAIRLAVSGAASPSMAPTAESGTLDRIDGPHRGVVGSRHDFNVPGLPVTSPCRICHIPHMQAVRATTQPTTRPALQLYRIEGQRRVFDPGHFTPGPTSLICLGCHDGTVASSMIGSSHALLAGVRAGFEVPEGYMWRDHPIGIPYPANNTRDFRPEAFVKAEGKIRLPEGRIECISCHDPHNQSGVDKMLVMSNRRSALCLACHIK